METAAAHDLIAFPGAPVVLFICFFFLNAIQEETVKEEVSSQL